jgi:hypothetical protein
LLGPKMRSAMARISRISGKPNFPGIVDLPAGFAKRCVSEFLDSHRYPCGNSRLTHAWSQKVQLVHGRGPLRLCSGQSAPTLLR